MTKERTPKTPRSIVRNHSPYCESTGPIVQEGFVAARVRALQGFSDQVQNAALSHSPLTPCPRPSLALKQALVGIGLPDSGIVKRFHTQILSNQDRNMVSAPGGSTSVSGVAPSFGRQEQQWSLEPTTPSRSYIRSRDPEKLSPDMFEDNVHSSCAQGDTDHVTAPILPYGPLSELHHIGNVHAEKSSRSEKSILGPHAIQADLVEPRATRYFLPQTEDCNNDYQHEQALKPRGSIADKLISMVEQGWEGGDTSGKFYSDDDFAPHNTESKFQSHDKSRSDSLSEMPHLKQVPSFSRSLSVLTAETRSESQHSIGQANPSEVKQEETRAFVHRGLQKRGKRQVKRSSPANTPQRSSSDFGVHYQKPGLAAPEGKQRARTLHHLGRSSSNHSQMQIDVFPSIGPIYAWDHRSNGQNHGPTQSPPSRECASQRSGFVVRDEQLKQDSAALLKNTSSRRSSSNAKESTRSASRSTSFFKKFPWYKVALVDKQPMVPSSSKGGCGNDRVSRNRASRATRAAQHDSAPNQIELSRRFGKSPTLIDNGEENEESPKMENPSHQGSIDQDNIDATTSYSKASSHASLQLMASPQEMNERQSAEQFQRVPARPQDPYTASPRTGKDSLSGNPHQVAKHVVGHARRATRTGPTGTQPRFPSESGSIDASFESAISGAVLQPPHSRRPEEMEHSHMQSYTASNTKLMKLHADNRLEKGSSASETTRPEQGFTASPSRPHELRSEVINLIPKRSWTESGSLPASVDKKQDGPVHQETRGGKGIKKIQVTVTFDGAEDLVIEATLRKRNRQKHWRTMA